MKTSPWRLLSIYLEGVLYLGGAGETGTRVGSSPYKGVQSQGTRQRSMITRSTCCHNPEGLHNPKCIKYDFYIPSYMDVYLEAIASVTPPMPEVTVDSHIQFHQGK